MLSEINLIGISLLLAFIALYKISKSFVSNFLGSYANKISEEINDLKALKERAEDELKKCKAEYQSLEYNRIKIVNEKKQKVNKSI